MKPNKDDTGFAECVREHERTAQMITKLLRQRLVFYFMAGIQFGLLALDMAGHLVSNTPRQSEAPMMLGVTAVLFTTLALHADAKIKTLLILSEIRNENQGA